MRERTLSLLVLIMSLYSFLFSTVMLSSVSSTHLFKRNGGVTTHTLRLFLMIDEVQDGNRKQEEEIAKSFLQKVNNRLAGISNLRKDVILRIELANFDVVPYSLFPAATNVDQKIDSWLQEFQSNHRGKGDFGMLFTKWKSKVNNGGVAKSTFCNRSGKPAALLSDFSWNKENGFTDVFIHEFSHLLGMNHDELLNCTEVGSLMYSKQITKSSFSDCSKAEFNNLYNKILKTCFEKIPHCPVVNARSSAE
ncbi:hypothetical protein HMI54_015699 [Coelomomyces lativittatus]|nr:hypothetical protein HMI54_015699 [Coelomomyces lativittatus]KAJ1518419.1 hypothetical protein HMI55_003551 [Coelomomyces lativittatus]